MTQCVLSEVALAKTETDFHTFETRQHEDSVKAERESSRSSAFTESSCLPKLPTCGNLSRFWQGRLQRARTVSSWTRVYLV
eukprot:1125853-Prorocentrum_minimum.AAC.1